MSDLIDLDMSIDALGKIKAKMIMLLKIKAKMIKLLKTMMALTKIMYTIILTEAMCALILTLMPLC